MTFRMNPQDTIMRRSVLPVAMAFMFKGGLNIMVKPQLFFKDDKFRIFGQFSYKNTQENFYGVGYSTNKDYVRSDTTSQYRYSGIQINPWLLFRIGESNFFVGPQIDLNYDKITDPAKYLTEQEDYKRAGGGTSGYSNFSSGLGFLLTYDTRDVPPIRTREFIWTSVESCIRNGWEVMTTFIASSSTTGSTNQLVSEKCWHGRCRPKNVFGNNIPLNKYVLSGTPFDLRGYYMGQYRDKSSHIALMEYRQMFNTDQSNWIKKIIHHLGFVAWGGAGFMGPTPGKIEGVLPNAGVGLRIEVQPRMNVRLDFGRNFINRQNLFYFNMTEAF